MEGQESVGLQDTISQGLEEEAAGAPAATETTTVPEKTEQSDAEKSAAPSAAEAAKWDGKERRKIDPDPEQDLGFEEEPGKGNRKMKLSELKSSAKWIFDNRKAFGWAMKMKEVVQANPEFGKLLDKIIASSFTPDGKSLNADFVSKTMSALDSKAEAVDVKIEAKDEAIENAKNALADLDPESPQARILTNSITTMENQRSVLLNTAAQLKSAAAKIDELSAKIEGLERYNKTQESRAVEGQQEVEVKRIADLFGKEFGALMDPNRKDKFEFNDEEEKQEFEQKVRQTVADNSEAIMKNDTQEKRDAAFVKAIQDAANTLYGRITARRQSVIVKHSQRKNPIQSAVEPKKEGEQEKPSMDIENLTDTVLGMMEKSKQ